MKTLKGRESKVYANGSGHITNMTAMPICGKSLLKCSSLEQKDQRTLALVCSIWDVGPSKSNDDLTL